MSDSASPGNGSQGAWSPGFYPDGQGNERFWDGQGWTEQVRPLAQSAERSEAYPAAGQSAAYGASGPSGNGAAGDARGTSRKKWPWIAGGLAAVVIGGVAIGSQGGKDEPQTAATQTVTSPASKAQSTSEATDTSTSESATTQEQPTTTEESPSPSPSEVASRTPEGKLTVLGAGTFAVGSKIPVGLYDVTAAKGEQGNFFVTGSDDYNEILGGSDLGLAKCG